MLREDSRLYSLNALHANYIFNGNYLSDVSFTVPRLISPHPNLVATYISLESATIPSSWYCIDETNNLISFIWYTATAQHNYINMVIPIGCYSAYSMVIALNNILGNTIVTGVQFAYNYNFNQIGVVLSGNTTTAFAITPATTVSIPLGLVFTNNANLIYTRNSGTQQDTYYFPNQCDFTGVNSYLIKAIPIPLQNWSTALQSDILGAIQNQASVWGITLWQNSSQSRYPVDVSNTTDYLRIQIYSEKGALVNFRGSAWGLTIKITYLLKNPVDYVSIEQHLSNPPPVSGVQKDEPGAPVAGEPSPSL